MDNNNEQPTIVSSNDVTDKFIINNEATTSVNNTPVVDNTQVNQVPPVVNQPTSVIQNTAQIPVQNVTPNVTGTDPNAMVNENLKKVEINYTPPSKIKVVLLVLFFIALLGFIIFLPDINTLISNFNKKEEPVEKITTGKLKCSISTNTTNLDVSHSYSFSFADNKLERIYYTVTTRGDVTLDEETLDKLANTCKQLKENSKSLKGVTIQCNYSDGELEEIQSFDLASVDSEKLNSAFTEAGGTVPTYQYGQDIDKIESNMNASKYECVRER